MDVVCMYVRYGMWMNVCVIFQTLPLDDSHNLLVLSDDLSVNGACIWSIGKRTCLILLSILHPPTPYILLLKC